MLEDIKWDYTHEIRKPILSGSLLLSEPFMKDPFFRRSVCLVCNHDKEEGTFGFITNKPTPQKVNELSDEMPDIDFPVFYGGPVAIDSLYYVHDNSTNVEGAIQLTDDLYWSGNFEQIRFQIQEGLLTEKSIRFFLGYSGWDKSQLRNEIIENSWIVSQEKVNLFDKNPLLWENILEKMGGVYKMMAGFPRDPSLN
ncbi:MAG: YqgE/AlgH family protein [Chitinophagales bacterium]